MNFVTVRDLRTTPRQVWDKLDTEREVVITNNGKPFALMIPIDESNFDDVLESVRQACAMRSMTRMHLAAAKTGLDKMNLEEINAEIEIARDSNCD
ncbi:MAG: type II toxin-antitoxin system Phd/YefM family antitoxin [Holophagales bacterium]|jgi:antitoxin (DNA-binding transcriptional repressor) of toxin-antitoxin stability system|nr:type II toxin-antitoxin system Phd/YefM family antitoxin [Holophagales bacterium]